MPEATHPTPSMSRLLFEAVLTNADTESLVTHDRERAHEARGGAWEKIIDHKLIEWGRDSSLLDDEGVDPPTPETIQLAIRLAESLRNKGCTPPDTVVPDPNGGIVFERREGDVSEVFQIWETGVIEYFRFRGADLLERWPL